MSIPEIHANAPASESFVLEVLLDEDIDPNDIASAELVVERPFGRGETTWPAEIVERHAATEDTPASVVLEHVYAAGETTLHGLYGIVAHLQRAGAPAPPIIRSTPSALRVLPKFHITPL